MVRDLITGNGRGFLWGIVKWCGIGGKICLEVISLSVD